VPIQASSKVRGMMRSRNSCFCCLAFL
jgi:hypothetical protein